MIVKLLQYTPDPERTCGIAARLCYSPMSLSELTNSLSAAEITRLLKLVISLGHLSVLEHASFTFGIEGVSRVTTHQLVRHRIASYSQQSQRYVEFDESFSEFTVPASVSNNPKAREIFNSSIQETTAAYHRLLDLGIPAEDARYLMPNATNTKIIVTMNARELRNFFSHRSCRRAQWEICELSDRMLQLCQSLAPVLFNLAGPACVTGRCPEGSLSCGSPRLDLRGDACPT